MHQQVFTLGHMKMLIFFLIRTHLAPRVNEGAHIDETTIIEQQYN